MSELMIRLRAEATPQERQSFAEAFRAALDRLGVEPGGPFVLDAGHAIDENQLGRSHTGDPETSREAARRNYGSTGTAKRKVFDHIADAERGKTFDECRIELGMYSAQKRLYDLKIGGWVVPSGERRPTVTGALADVYVLSEQARAHLEAAAALARD